MSKTTAILALRLCQMLTCIFIIGAHANKLNIKNCVFNIIKKLKTVFCERNILFFIFN
jgi:hypothetical protein